MSLSIGVEVEGLPSMWKRLNALPKTAQQEMREAAMAIADDEAARIRNAASSDSRQAAAIAPFIKARRDRVPAISAGGKRRAGVSGGALAGEIFFGAEFGGQHHKARTTTGRGGGFVIKRTTMQFRPHRGHEGYFFFPTLREDQDRMLDRYEMALRNLEREWARG